MYAYINGIISSKAPDYVVCDVGGVGYLLLCSKNTSDAVTLNKPHKLYVHMSVSQDNISLYGFDTESERDMFRLLISVSRIGSKIALAALSMLTVDDIIMAITTENAAALSSVPGMGTKTASRILLELKEKVTLERYNENDTIKAQRGTRAFDMRSEAISALIVLGYDGLSAGQAVSSVADSEFTTVEQLIKRALSSIPERGAK